MGKSKGNLTDEEIQGALSDIDLNDHQIERIYSYFKDAGIDVVEDPSHALDADAVADTVAEAEGRVVETVELDAEDDDAATSEAAVVDIELPKVAPKAGKKKAKKRAAARAASAGWRACWPGSPSPAGSLRAACAPTTRARSRWRR